MPLFVTRIMSWLFLSSLFCTLRALLPVGSILARRPVVCGRGSFMRRPFMRRLHPGRCLGYRSGSRLFFFFFLASDFFQNRGFFFLLADFLFYFSLLGFV